MVAPSFQIPREGPGLACVETGDGTERRRKIFAVGGKGSAGATEVHEEGQDSWRVLEGCAVAQESDEYTAVVVSRVP